LIHRAFWTASRSNTNSG